ncbi:MAG TPA: hypothetical protein VFM39_01170 [bacterium]|nr:hypothetical protein [bacterium]
MTEPLQAVAADPLAAGWTALRAFFSEGAAARDRALEAFQAAERAVRASGDSSTLSLWLLGMATALRYTRRPEPMEAGLARARELVNLIAREMSESATIPYRTYVEAAYRDLADVIPAQSESLLNEAIAYSDRTLRLAKATARDEWVAAAQASRGDLLLRRARDRRALRRALVAHEDARRRWSSRDAEGRAQAGIGYGETLLALGEAAKAERIARESLGVFVRSGDRYHEAAARLLLARALFALDQSDALDEQASAVALYQALGCAWEARRAEGALG